MQHTRADEFRLLEALSENCSDFGQRLLLFPSATTFHTYPKNRYKNILPNEHTRVKLNPIGNQEGSDYINANFITLPISDDEECVYISTQAPLETTFADFWRMVWEQRSTCIVSLTKLSEKNRVKADRYWPSQVGESEQYGELRVINQHVLDLGFIVRKFLLIKNSEQRIILQFHYSDWPDFGVPTRSTDIRHMIQLSDIWKQESSDIGLDGPLIVHCSAGVGRSGSFIAMHAGMKAIHKNCQTDSSQVSASHVEQVLSSQGEQNESGTDNDRMEVDCNSGSPLDTDSETHSPNPTDLEMPNVMELVRVMRNQRHGMVQTVEQYQFIYTVLDDELEERKTAKFGRTRTTSGSGGSGPKDGILLNPSESASRSDPSSGYDDPFGTVLPQTSSVPCPSTCLSCPSCSSSPLSPSSTNSPSSPTNAEGKNAQFDFEKIFEALSCPHRSFRSFGYHEKDVQHEKDLEKPDTPNATRKFHNQICCDNDSSHDGRIINRSSSPKVFSPAVAVSG